jgi:hypothetical protein
MGVRLSLPRSLRTAAPPWKLSSAMLKLDHPRTMQNQVVLVKIGGICLLQVNYVISSYYLFDHRDSELKMVFDFLIKAA